jgi:hypothetical protein
MAKLNKASGVLKYKLQTILVLDLIGYQSAPFSPNIILPVSSAVSSCYLLKILQAVHGSHQIEMTVYV